jgi:DNA-binding MarR family transcriptional regulator
MSANELADILLMDRTTLLRALKPLREKELIVSASDATEPRRHLFSLPPLGAAKIEEAEPLWQAAQDEYEHQVGTENAFRLRGEFLGLTGAKA